MTEKKAKKTEKVEKVTNIVEMQDGTKIDFGKRGTLHTSVDLPTNTISFKMVTGDIINWVVPGTEGLTDFQKKVYLYGILSKIKTAMAPVDLKELKKFIEKQMEAINNGIFIVRAFGDTVREVKLTDIQKAYAIAKSKQNPDFIHWGNVEDTSVIEQVSQDWEAKSTSEKNADKRNPYVQLELATMHIAANPEVGAVL